MVRNIINNLEQRVRNKEIKYDTVVTLPCDGCKKHFQTTAQQYIKNKGFCYQCSTRQQTIKPKDQTKAMEKEHIIMKLHPNFLKEFLDEDNNIDYDEIQQFMDSLEDEQLRIMKENSDNLPLLLSLKLKIQTDVNDTAKALAME